MDKKLKKRLEEDKVYEKLAFRESLLYLLSTAALMLFIVGLAGHSYDLRMMSNPDGFIPTTVRIDSVDYVRSRTSMGSSTTYLGIFNRNENENINKAYVEIGKNKQTVRNNLKSDSVISVFIRPKEEPFYYEYLDDTLRYDVVVRDENNMSYTFWEPFKSFIKRVSIFHLPFIVFVFLTRRASKKKKAYEKEWLRNQGVK